MIQRQPLETPVALIVFNRPEHTKAVFERIREARPKQLFIIADGPRTAEEMTLCETTRNITGFIDWDCVVKRNYSEKNLGCDDRTASGISWVFHHVDRAIILEDDDLPHSDFFLFSADLLERYKDDKRIMSISGNNYHQKNSSFSCSDSYYLSLIPFIHGFATWRRAWTMYDTSLSHWPTVRDRGLLASVFPDPAVRSHWEYKFAQFHSNALTSWDGKWAFACVVNRGLSINPRVNLVTNIGYGPGATHTTDTNKEQGLLPVSHLPPPYLHPPAILPDAAAESYTYRTFFGINREAHQRAISFVRYHFPALYQLARASLHFAKTGLRSIIPRI